MKNKFFFLFFTLTAALSCTDDENQSNPACQLDKIVYKNSEGDLNYIKQFTYDSDGRLTKITQTEADGAEYQVDEYTYLSNTIIVNYKLNGTFVASDKFTYGNNGMIETAVRERPATGIEFTETFTYDVSKKLITREYESTGPGYLFKRKIQFTYSEGNMIQLRSYQNTSTNPSLILNSVTDYSGYDDKLNMSYTLLEALDNQPVLVSFTFLTTMPLSKNNPALVATSFGESSYEYSYDSEGEKVVQVVQGSSTRDLIYINCD